MVVYQALCGWGVCIEHARMRFVAGLLRGLLGVVAKG